MAKKDIRNGKESGNWRPARWTPAKVRRFLRHVTKRAWHEAANFPPCDEMLTLTANFLGDAKERESAVMLRALGVKTIGDIERGAS